MDALKALGVSLVSASVDTGENAQEVADSAAYPVGQGVTRETADKLGAWWEPRRDCIQPAEFLLNREGKVLISSYSSGPIARMNAAEVIAVIGFIEKMKKK